MNPEVLAKLKDIHVPSDVAWWPLALGWWILLGGFLLVLGLVIYLIIRANRKSKQDVIVGQSLNVFHDLKDQSLSPRDLLIALSELLRRTAISLYGRAAVANLSGTEWLNFLNEKGKTTAFTDGVGQALQDQPYRQVVEYNQQALLVLVDSWLNIQLKPSSSVSKKTIPMEKRGKHV